MGNVGKFRQTIHREIEIHTYSTENSTDFPQVKCKKNEEPALLTRFSTEPTGHNKKNNYINLINLVIGHVGKLSLELGGVKVQIPPTLST